MSLSMASKRSRIARSSSQGEVGRIFESKRLQPVAPPLPSYSNWKLVTEVRQQKQLPPSIFTLGSPDHEGEKKNENVDAALAFCKMIKKAGGEGFGEFLKACFLCRKKLDSMDAYMYGYLGAFCSSECRDNQLALDGFDEQIAKERMVKAAENVLSKAAPQKMGLRCRA